MASCAWMDAWMDSFDIAGAQRLFTFWSFAREPGSAWSRSRALWDCLIVTDLFDIYSHPISFLERLHYTQPFSLEQSGCYDTLTTLWFFIEGILALGTFGLVFVSSCLFSCFLSPHWMVWLWLGLDMHFVLVWLYFGVLIYIIPWFEVDWGYTN